MYLKKKLVLMYAIEFVYVGNSHDHSIVLSFIHMRLCSHVVALILLCDLNLIFNLRKLLRMTLLTNQEMCRNFLTLFLPYFISADFPISILDYS